MVANPYQPGELATWVVYDDIEKTDIEMTIRLNDGIDPSGDELEGMWGNTRVVIMCAQNSMARFVRVWED